MPRAGRMLAWGLAALGGPVVALTAIGGLLARNWLATAFLAVCYEIVVGVAVLAGESAAKRVKIRLEQLADWVDQAAGRRMSPYGRKYRTYMLAESRVIDLKGVATAGSYTPELDEVYVDPGLVPRPAYEVPGSLVAALPGDLTQRYHGIDELLSDRNPVALAVLGGPGSGKTTLLRHLVRETIRPRRGLRARRLAEGHRRRGQIPILLVLRDHAGRIAERPRVPLAELVRDTVPDLGVREPPGWWDQQLHAGACLVLLDGLDEVARPEDRKAVTVWIEQQLSQYPGNDFVITSRPHAYPAPAIGRAQVMQVRPFADEHVRRFLHAWYLAIERRDARGDSGRDRGRGIEIRARERAADLIDRLAAAPALLDLTVNPLLLTMIASVHRSQGGLIADRATLYKDICNGMLWSRRAVDGRPGEDGGGWLDRPSGEFKVPVMAALAFRMMRGRDSSLPKVEVLDAVGSQLRYMSIRVTAEELLADVVASGFLHRSEQDRYSFAHQTFGEYLAAVHIVKNGLHQVLADAVDDMWWRETTLLYVVLADATPIVRACLASGSLPALALAFDCVPTAGGIGLAQEQREALAAYKDKAFDPTADPGLRRLVAAALVTRHLHRFVLTPDDSRVCPIPISGELHLLFRRDTGTPAPDGPLVAEPGGPVTGVWGHDAVALTAWVNSVIAGENGSQRYRLPTHREVQYLASQPGMLSHPGTMSVWTQPEQGAGPGLWIAADRPDPRLVTGLDLIVAATHDAATSPVLLQLALASASALALDLDGALVRAGTADDAVDRAVGLAVPLARTLDLALRRDPGLAHALALDLDLNARDVVLGAALARTLAAVQEQLVGRRRLPDLSGPAGTFARTLTGYAGVTDAYRATVTLDTLAYLVRDACTTFTGSQEPPTSRAAVIARRLAETAEPLFARRRPLAAGDPIAVRLPALVLAAEASDRRWHAVGESFRSVAAGVTLLQRRATQQPPTENILLTRA
ncbi:hypothetical protein Lfu02_41530 [Longispora fulva]|uniref:NACHT domain-containing protein n=1 Tax=Longispora fulva TaxID=619741 RepID=A0A8J7GH59_9ACTN|nr:NACHT domain-containing protein [Longispora fulva]MBG6136612.1 hypothetical protein [Longispora fulva]GIG59781.1 hypothetical protein Lfu02_41530 [Longispora fulva]